MMGQSSLTTCVRRAFRASRGGQVHGRPRAVQAAAGPTSLRPAMDWLLIIIAAVIAVIVVGMNILLMITYAHPEDKNQAFMAKLIVVSFCSPSRSISPCRSRSAPPPPHLRHPSPSLLVSAPVGPPRRGVPLPGGTPEARARGPAAERRLAFTAHHSFSGHSFLGHQLTPPPPPPLPAAGRSVSVRVRHSALATGRRQSHVCGSRGTAHGCVATDGCAVENSADGDHHHVAGGHSVRHFLLRGVRRGVSATPMGSCQPASTDYCRCYI